MKTVGLDELVKVDAEQLCNDAKMISERKIVGHLDDVVFLLRIPFAKVIQHLDFDYSLLVETVLVPDDLDGHSFASHVITTLQNLAEAAFAQNVHNFEAEHDVVTKNNVVVAPFIIKAIIVLAVVPTC